MKQRKRKYQDGDYGHKRWPRGKPMLQVAMAIEPTDDTQEDTYKTLRFVFHGAFKLMLSHVFRQLRERLFNDYSVTEEVMQIVNGKCYRSLIIQIEQPDLHRLSLTEWPLIIKSMMERTFRCKLTYFTNYEKFLNA
jgi:hypothetical protein